MSLRVLVWLCCVLLAVAGAARANPALEGYSNHEQLQQRLSKLAGGRVQVTSLGQTRGKRDIFLVKVGSGEFDKKPAVLIVGDVAPSEVAGSELVVRMIEQLLDRAGKDEQVAKMLERRTFYFIPRPSPDAAEKCFAKPFREPAGNATPTDDDRDGKQGEDPPDDLNDDGWITMLRVEDVGGEFIPHPDDPRVMIRAELSKQERGKYKLLIEGRDNDGDEQLNEDAGDGVSFNRNFTFQYPAFKANAGRNAVSEAETRAVADFCFDHPNIAAVWTMTPEDNLLHPWKPDGAKDKAKIRTTILSDDAKYQDILASLFQKTRDAKGAPGSPDGEGSFSEWAYFHYGRGSLATRPWWIPPVEPKEGEKKSEEKRGADDLNALRYFAANNIDGFVDWKPIEHPDFPGQKVEVGSFKPFYRTHPPVAELDGIAAKFTDYLVQAEALAPKLALAKLKADSLGGGVVRLSVTIVNEGLLPTHLEMGEVSQQTYPLQLAWSVPEKSTWLQGSARSRLGRLAGNGGFVEKVSLVRLPEPLPKELKVRVYAPAVGSVEGSVDVK
jgi:hypothetical protein